MVIRMRHTRSHTANRRSHHALTAPNMAVCKNCGAYHRQHHMCLSCGYYKGRIVTDLLTKKKDREARMAAKKEAVTGHVAEEVAAPVETEAKPKSKSKKK